MIWITVDNSETRIEGLSIELHKKLAKILSYTTVAPNSYASRLYPPRPISLLSKKGIFPTGLLERALSFFKHSKVEVHLVDLRKAPSCLQDRLEMTLSHLPYKEQEEASWAAVKHVRGIIVAPTGLGKSVISALIISKLQVSTLLVVPSLELKRQLTETLTETFGKDRVGYNKDIMVCNVDSVNCTKRYDAVIIDEFHHSAAKTYRKLNKTKFSSCYYRVGLSATPFRSQDHEMILLESVLSQVIYRVPYQVAVDNKYIVPLEVYTLEIPKTRLPEDIVNSWPKVYNELVVNNHKRNEMIAELLKNAQAADLSMLCLIKEIKHGEILSKLTGVPFANGEDEGSHDLISKFSSKALSCLIGTTGIVGEGVDTRACEYVIIAGLGKAKTQFMQSIGRGFRNFPGKESCKIILILDRSHKWTKSHYAEQCKILREEFNTIPGKL
jgi:superfamily II DNA or RNA helicase